MYDKRGSTVYAKIEMSKTNMENNQTKIKLWSESHVLLKNVSKETISDGYIL